jgi:parvulin-like peptidyl-prolyl isomerase
LAKERKDKDPKKLYHWDDDAEKTGKDGTEEDKVEPVKKKSKKVARREAKEAEKKRKKAILEERQKTRITKKGKIWIIVGSSLAAIAIILALLFAYFGIGVDLTRTLARFDNMKVTQKEVDVYVEFLKNQNPDSVPPLDDPQYEALEKNIMDSIIVLKVLQKYGKENGFAVTDAEIDEEYSKIIENYPSQEDFEKDLADKKISKSFLREQISDQMLRDKIFNDVTKDIIVSEEEIKDYYGENDETLFQVPEQKKVSHILIKFDVPEGETIDDEIKSEARKQIEDIEQQLEDGADFAELATQYSQDTLSAENGGDIGFISRGQTVAEFEDAAFALKAGEVSPIVETYYGYHLIKVLEEQDAYIKSFDEVRETIETYLLNNKQIELWQDFVYGLVEVAGIEYTTGLVGQLLEDTGIPVETAPASGDTGSQ